MWPEVKASQRLRQVFFFASSISFRLAKFQMFLFRLSMDDLERSFFFVRKSLCKAYFSGKFHEAARDFQSVKIQF